MKKFYIILVVMLSLQGYGQDLERLKLNMEQNNPKLVALQKWLDAEELNARTGIYPENPTMRYIYLFGNAAAFGDQQEFEITQSFRLPGYYNSKAALQHLQFEQKEALAKIEKRKVLIQMYDVYFNMVWLDKKAELLENRKAESEQLAEALKTGYENGEVSRPAYDKARLYNINIQNEWNKTTADIQIEKERLLLINGEAAVDDYMFEYPLNWKLPVLDTLLGKLPENNPELLIAKLEISAAEKRLKHEKMNYWPAFEAGYKYETVLSQQLQGFHAGVSIPLWHNTNMVKQAKVTQDWSQENYRQKESELNTRVKILYNEVLMLQNNYEQMKTIIDEQVIAESSLELLKAGQITFADYIVDMDLIVQTRKNFLEIEHSYFTKLSELKTMIGYEQ